MLGMGTEYIICNKRFGECLELREFVRIGIQNYMVRELARQILRKVKMQPSSFSALDLAWEVLCWNCKNIKYPWDTSLPEWMLAICDGHVLIAFPVPKYMKVRKNMVDFWQLPQETLAHEEGDCEDKSFLSTAVLENIRSELGGGANFKVYAVLGIVNIEGHEYGHAWTELCIENTRYILENTLTPDLLNSFGKHRYFNIMRADRLYGRLYEPLLWFNSSEVIENKLSGLGYYKKLRKLGKTAKKLRNLIKMLLRYS